MSKEIPDSDEESDFETRPEIPTHSPPPETHDQPSTEDGQFDVNFDEFISQSQSVRDGSSQLGQTKHSTASTQKHLQEALEGRRTSASSSYDGAEDIDGNMADALLAPQAVVKKKRRARSEIGDAYTHEPSSQNRAKRTKTYGASSRLTMSTQNMEEPWGPAAMECYSLASPIAEMLPPQVQEDEEDITSRAKNVQGKGISRLGNSVASVGNVFSMSRSSMGGYESFNLDFRGPGTNIDANPFIDEGFQVSAYADQQAELHVQGDLSDNIPLTATPRRPGRDDISPLTDERQPSEPTEVTATSLDPSLLDSRPPEESQMLASQVVNATAGTFASHFMMASAQHRQESPQEAETEVNRTERDSASKKRGHESKPCRQSSRASTQDMATDQLDDDSFDICLPKDQYQAGPSKSRGSTIETERLEQPLDEELPMKKKGRKKSLRSAPREAQHDSPAKLPTSELHLSDEAFIGLPKENYNPRPSKRRARMVAEDIAACIEVDTSAAPKNTEEPLQSQQSKRSEALHALEVPEAPMTKPRKGKKAKVKRAKTSAAGLLRKSEPMLSDGEDDVLWMDTKPAKVKLDLPADTLPKKALKEDVAESTATAELNAPEQPLEGIGKPLPSARPITVTVEIPAPPEEDKPEPKKRGRKSKSAVIVEEDDDPEPEPHDSPTSTVVRQSSPTILKEKHTNTTLPPPTPTKTVESSSPAKAARITHSPINPSGGKVLYRVGLSRRSAIPPLLKMVKPPARQQQAEKENLDEEGKPRDLVAETMRKWREMGVLD